MPFGNITIYDGHGKDRKGVVFNEVTPPDWYVAGHPGKK